MRALGLLLCLNVCAFARGKPATKKALPQPNVAAPKEALLAAAAQLVGLVTSGGEWERFVWTISPSGRYDQHPRRHARADWPRTGDAAAFARACFLRTERQTFFPLGDDSALVEAAILRRLEAVGFRLDVHAA